MRFQSVEDKCICLEQSDQSFLIENHLYIITKRKAVFAGKLTNPVNIRKRATGANIFSIGCDISQKAGVPNASCHCQPSSFKLIETDCTRLNPRPASIVQTRCMPTDGIDHAWSEWLEHGQKRKEKKSTTKGFLVIKEKRRWSCSTPFHLRKQARNYSLVWYLKSIFINFIDLVWNEE